jgi:hypothetical protein
MTINRQEIFDNAVRGVMTQGDLAIAEGTYTCAYRGENNTRCAIGWNISDDVYSEDMEGNVPNLIYEAPNIVARAVHARTKGDIAFLRNLQRCHDLQLDYRDNRNILMHRLAASFKLFAEMYSLSYMVLFEDHSREYN